jgi:hypothetical protein
MKIQFEYFWGGFNPKDFFLLKYFDNPEIVTTDDYDFIILSVFPNKKLQINSSAKIIVFNGEHPDYVRSRIISLGIKPNIVIGYIDTYNYFYPVKKIYYPLWLLYYPQFDDKFILDIELNKHITIQDINKKKFCCLINSHDNNVTRKPIYNALTIIDRIDCPGLLLNNLDRSLVGTSSEDKLKFMNSYIFNICSENIRGIKYLTEKLPQALNSCCIPIYYGELSDINQRIFNQDRIIIVDDFSSNTMTQLRKKIKKLFDNKCDLLKFYKKPIFTDNAYDEYKKFIEDFETKFKDSINSN